MKTRYFAFLGAAFGFPLILSLSGCTDSQQTTSVPVSVATLVKPYGLVDLEHDCSDVGGPFAPDIQAWWDGLSPTNKQSPFVGYETWRNAAFDCTTSRVDDYHGLFTFNLASVANLRGLVVSAELIVSSRAVPAPFPSFPGAVSGGILGCQTFTGGAGALERFGPAAAATLPAASGAGVLHILQSDPIPVGDVVFTFPRPWVAGPVAGATSPTSTVASGTGGATFTVDVTNPVSAALSAGAAGLSWALSTDFVGPMDRPVGTTPRVCKTSYDMQLSITHR
jgi:hypothetical protein